MEISALLRGALAFPATLGSAVLHEGRNIPKWLVYNLIGDWLDYYDTHNGHRGVIYLVPGVAETYLAMVPLANFLHRRGFNVRIFPKGTYTPTVEDGANIVSQRVQEARQHFQHHRFVLIGHSWGAAVAAEVNRRHGDVVDLCLALALPSRRTPLALPASFLIETVQDFAPGFPSKMDDIVQYLAAERPANFRVFFGAQDELAPPDPRLPNAVVLPGVSHTDFLFSRRVFHQIVAEIASIEGHGKIPRSAVARPA